jgi:class 3 adenylate cyclase
MKAAASPWRRIWSRVRRLYLPLYLLIAVSVLLGGTLVRFYQGLAGVDFGQVMTFVDENPSLFRGITPADQGEWERRGREAERIAEMELGPGAFIEPRDTRISMRLLLAWAAIALWLLPLYRRTAESAVSATVQRRILKLPQVVLLIPWIIAGMDAMNVLLWPRTTAAGGGGELAIYLISFLMFGGLTSQLNVTLTLPYITHRIAATEFTGESRFRLKEARAISIANRVQLIILTLGLLPILLAVATPVMFNWWLIDRTRESGVIDVVELSRAFAPVVVMVIVGLYFIVGQIMSLVAFRRAVQQPLDALIDRMRSVAAGDFGVRTSVLSGDEIGVLKGHFNTMVEGLEEREKIRNTFGRSVSMEIAEKLMNGGAVDLEGEEIVTTVMFADIRSFTALSERMAPRDLVTFLNEYFSFVVRPIAAERGVVNKFIGDSVMAVFSPVFGVANHAEAAVRAALGMRAALAAFNAEGRWETIRQGVGIHSGVLVAGTVGAEERREYTVIGDTVNVASRIESQTKVAETDILVSGATVDLVDPMLQRNFGLRETAPVIMRGKSTPTRLFLV